MELEVVMGLETHVQLKTKSKLFCACSNADGADVNVNICPVCTGHPGTLPVPNEQAIRFAVLTGLALKGTITTNSKFDRKNYYYPDLPKAYQISQFDLPVMRDGELTIDVPGQAEPVTIRIERLHLEEDAAKNIHGADGKTYVDYNRGGTPLCEIVTRPDFHTAAEAKAYVQELRLLVRTLGVSDADMEKGHLRCDVNISLRPKGDENLYTKTELKNINSFRAIERAIEYEVKRQTELWEAGTPPTATTTRGWNDEKQITESQREKEDSADYRYFPEPDIPPLDLADLTAELKRKLPELPAARRLRLSSEYGFRADEARQIVDDPALMDFTERALSELGAWLEAKPDVTSEGMSEARQKLMKTFSGWLLNKLPGLLEERKSDIRIMKVSPENFAEFITLLGGGQLTGPKGLEVLAHMLDTGANPTESMTEMGASRVDDASALEKILDLVFENNPKEVARYKGGETKLVQFFVGQAMRETKGNADPQILATLISERLGR